MGQILASFAAALRGDPVPVERVVSEEPRSKIDLTGDRETIEVSEAIEAIDESRGEQSVPIFDSLPTNERGQSRRGREAPESKARAKRAPEGSFFSKLEGVDGKATEKGIGDKRGRGAVR